MSNPYDEINLNDRIQLKTDTCSVCFKYTDYYLSQIYIGSDISVTICDECLDRLNKQITEHLSKEPRYR